MKVQVSLKTLTGEKVTLQLTVALNETVGELKERVVLNEPNPFPEQALLCDGRALRDDLRLSECGIEDGALLTFTAQATEESLAQQLQGLLAEKGPLPVEELSLLYCLQHGVAVSRALGALGSKPSLQAFLEKCSTRFTVERGHAKLAAPLVDDHAQVQQQFSVVVEVILNFPSMTQAPSTLDFVVDATDTVLDIKERAAAALSLPFPDRTLLFRGAALEDGQCLPDCGVAEASSLKFVVAGSEEMLAQQLAAILKTNGPCSRVELDDTYCCRHGASATQALQMLGWNEKLLHFLERQPLFKVEKGCVTLVQDPAPSTSPLPGKANGNQRYLDLHAQLTSDDFAAQASEALDRLANALAQETFLNIRRVVKAGAVAKDTAIPGAVGAEVVLFLDGLPPTSQDDWLPGLARSVAGGLSQCLIGQEGVKEVQVADGALILCTDGPLGNVRVLLSPAYASYSASLQALRSLPPTARGPAGAAAFAAQRVRFVERQPEAAKATMRLLKWWREQRQWSSMAARPSDELLECVVAYTTAQKVPSDLRSAVEKALAALASFDKLQVTWPLASRCYREEDIPKAVLQQRPLIMDPANPLANIADPQAFQPDELVQHARSGSFFP